MSKTDLLFQVLEAREIRSADRRKFIKVAGTGTALVAGTSLLAGCFGDGDDDDVMAPAPSPTPTPTTSAAQQQDIDVLTFALNLEYLEAQFYSFAANGTGLPAGSISGPGNFGNATGGRQVNFTDPIVAQYAREIAADEKAHVDFLRSAIGSTAPASPPIDIGTAPAGAFSSAARAAGLIGPGESFDPYASDENFLLAAFIFEDVGVTAYKGASPLISNKTYLEAAAGILAAEAYHAGLVRTVLYRKGIAAPTLVDATEKISDARDSLDGPTDLDQGIRIRNGASNIVPTDANGLAFSRTAGQVLNIAYLTKLAAQQGGFFPQGVNGNIRTSAAN